jgi:entericidin B
MKMLRVLVSIVLLASVVTGCNTVKGAGQDVQQGGKAISGAADDASK